tara:strand:- start:4631 stop:5224 length:594 start_codon:yes stop_codon:yes gene_type:complete
MTRRRPHMHVRRIKTKRGIKKRIINPHIKKVTLNKKDRMIFNHLSNPNKYNIEFGGGLDFKKDGKLDRIQVKKGQHRGVNLPNDYEVMYHTHPDNQVNPPTVDDVIALIKTKPQQAQLIFRKGHAYTIIKTPKTKPLSKLPTNQLRKKLDKATSSFMFKKDWEKKLKKALESMGFIVLINNNPKTNLRLNIRPVEPK